jgi:hypothetical protein
MSSEMVGDWSVVGRGGAGMDSAWSSHSSLLHSKSLPLYSSVECAWVPSGQDDRCGDGRS